ncbi:transcriptional regulator, partial [Streptomyces sp. OfavH-34-F]|nr:transcriptional regulator [Streptomyces sp. OfavH-34-F]
AVRTPAHDRGRVHRLAVLTAVELRQGEADRAAATATEMAERVRGMESRRLRDRLRTVRTELMASGSADAERAAERVGEALRVPL